MVCGLQFHCLTTSFKKKFIILMKYNLSICSFMDHDFIIGSKKCLHYSRSERLLFSFLLKIFCFMFYIHVCNPVWVTFCIKCDRCITVNFLFVYEFFHDYFPYPIFPAPFIERLILSNLSCLCLTSVVHIYVTLFLNSLFCFIDLSLRYFQCLDYCDFTKKS